MLPYDFSDKNIFDMFYDIKNSWKLEQIQTGVGSMISCENILKNNFSEYYAIYTTAPAGYKTKNCFIKPSGNYICYHHKGYWDTLPEAYNKIISYAKENSLKLCGYSYEIGLNEFAI